MFEVTPNFRAGRTDDPARMLAELYSGLLDVGGKTIATVVELLADERSAPTLVYCAAGKDRTGVTTAVLLKLLGVADEEIVDDYAASKEPVEALLRWMESSDQAGHEEMVQLPQGLTAAPPEAMREFLAQLDEQHGSAADYVRHLGVGDSTIDRLRRNLLN